MTPEEQFTEPALQLAVEEIRAGEPSPAVMEAAAARVWAKLAETVAEAHGGPIRGCADVQALLAEFRAGRLPSARAMLVEDHLHECVACRRVYEGKTVAVMPPADAPATVHRRRMAVWAAAAAAAVAASTGIYIFRGSSSEHTVRAVVQALDGRLFVVTAAGFQPLAQGQDLPEGVEIRTAQDSDAVLRLRDGSLVELRERSGVSAAQAGPDMNLRLTRGSLIVEAAKRTAGHLYVSTADYRVAVTGTIFGVSAGAKGSRVSVIQGQVRVAQGSDEQLLRPGEQSVSNPVLEPEPVRQDIAWSRNRARYDALLGLRTALERVRLPELRYSSKLLDRLPQNTAVYASIPNLADYLGQVQSVFSQQLAETPALAEWWGQHGDHVQPMLEKLRAASGYLGDEIVLVAVAGGHGPALMAEVKRDGFAQFLAGQGLPLAVESRHGLVVFGLDRQAVAQLAPAMDTADGGFRGTPLYTRIAQAYSRGAGLLLCADLAHMGRRGRTDGPRYFVAEEKAVDHRMESRATLGLEGGSQGPADWLDAPGPMGSLDYVSPDASAVGAFLTRHPAALIARLTGALEKKPAGRRAAAPELQADMEAGLGGEFAVALDGPLVPVPSWKLIVEVYDPVKVESAIERLVGDYNRHPISGAIRSLTVSREADCAGAACYRIVASPKNPLIEAHYTFSGGYLIAAPTRAVLERALQEKQSGTSILRSSKFMSLTPRDHYANFSAVIYQSLGRSLAPFAGMLGQPAAAGLGDLKPLLIAVYREPDSFTAASNGDVLALGLGNLLAGNSSGWLGGLTPFGHLLGTYQRQPAYKDK